MAVSGGTMVRLLVVRKDPIGVLGGGDGGSGVAGWEGNRRRRG